MEDSEQIAQICMLNYIFAGCTFPKVLFHGVAAHLYKLVKFLLISESPDAPF